MSKDLVGTKNAGFEIIKQGQKAVIGVREADGLCVAWNYRIDRSGEPDFFWGRYGRQIYAEDCYNLKEAGKFSGEGAL
jgi:hypothetical protein